MQYTAHERVKKETGSKISFVLASTENVDFVLNFPVIRKLLSSKMFIKKINVLCGRIKLQLKNYYNIKNKQKIF